MLTSNIVRASSKPCICPDVEFYLEGVNFPSSSGNSSDIVPVTNLVWQAHMIRFKCQHTGLILSPPHTPHSIRQQILLARSWRYTRGPLAPWFNQARLTYFSGTIVTFSQPLVPPFCSVLATKYTLSPAKAFHFIQHLSIFWPLTPSYISPATLPCSLNSAGIDFLAVSPT